MGRPRRPSLADVAARAGVSIGTVSHVLNHPERVRAATRLRVREAIAELGFVRNANAHSLAGGGARTIGLVIPDIGNSLFVDIARAAQERALENRTSLLVADSNNDDALQDRHLEFFASARVSGILLAPMRDPGIAVRRVRRLGIPVVLLNYAWDDDEHCSVVIDNRRAGELAARHLLELGRRRLAFVGGHDELQPVRDRREGVRSVVAASRGLATLVEIPTEDLVATGGVHAAAALLGLPDLPDGVIAVTDLLAMGLLQTLVQHGVAVPDDLALMGSDDNASAWGGSVPMTSVQMHGRALGAAATALLTEEMTDADHEHRRVEVAPTLAVRESTAGRAPADA
ncbi:LacI family DNA-binding transcriptional regulator [Georgenia alba]|uniref:LacI family DNA-binding transcriptional regulator n=1 Tax=Georgenia alba TaxID=2233858 RepID=A0ABW2QB89_9MICO